MGKDVLHAECDTQTLSNPAEEVNRQNALPTQSEKIILNPGSLASCTSTRPGILKGIMRASSRPEAITVGLKPRFPAWFKRILDHRLSHSVDQTGNAQRTGFAIPFRNVNASCGLDSA